MMTILFTNGNKYTGEKIEHVSIISIKDGQVEWTNDESFGAFEVTENFEILPE